MKGFELEEISTPEEDIDILSLHREITRKLKVYNSRDDQLSRSPKSVSPRSPRSPKTGNKCGRPSNPIPRHKRESHIKAEHKRRDKIQKGFDTLRTLVPALEDASAKESKAVMLFQTAEHCRKLEADCKGLQDEEAALRQEIQSLGSQIHALQTKLPSTGIEATEKPGSDINQLYEEYMLDRSKKNWKFWLFDFMIKPLFESFKAMVVTTTYEQFTDSVKEWVRDKLSLPNLRIGFLSSLREISTKTKILDEPSKLSEKAFQYISRRRGNTSDIAIMQPSTTDFKSECQLHKHNQASASEIPTASSTENPWNLESLSAIPNGDLNTVDEALITRCIDDIVSPSDVSDMHVYDIPVTSSSEIDMSFADSLLNTLVGIEPMIVNSLSDPLPTDIVTSVLTNSTELCNFTSCINSFPPMTNGDDVVCSTTMGSNDFARQDTAHGNNQNKFSGV